MITNRQSKRLLTLVIVLITFSFLGLVSYYYFSENKTSSPSPYGCKDCNVILITMSNLRYDHMSSNGYFRPTTPNLDNFAKESIMFDNAFSLATLTRINRVSLYTGLYPFQHGFMGENARPGDKLSQEVPTIIDVLKRNGYTTAAFTGAGTSINDRFDEYQRCDIGLPNSNLIPQKRHYGSVIFGELSCSVPKALAWIKKNTPSKFFLHVQGYDLHCPFSQRGGYAFDKDYKSNIDYSSCLGSYARSEPILRDGKKYYLVYSDSEKVGAAREVFLGEEDIRHLVALYDESIVFADKEIGRLLNEIKKMGFWDNTIIIFTSEHGEMFGKHGLFMRGGTTYYDDVLHVPLIIHHPGLKAMRLNGLVSLIDVPQTLVDLLGLEKLKGDGKSVVPLVLGGKEIHSEVFAGSISTPTASNFFLSNKSYVAAIRTKEWKLIEETIVYEKGDASKKIELYDIVNDKEELNNLADKRQDVLRNMQSALDMWLRSVKE